MSTRRSAFLLTLILYNVVGSVFCADNPVPQDGPRKDAPMVYLDCSFCEEEFIRSEIQFVNYVRDRAQAQIHILAMEQPTGSGGVKYTLSFFGQKEFDNMNDQLEFVTQPQAPQEELRQAIAHHLRLGLVRYVAKTPLKDAISIGFDASALRPDKKDPWDSWVFTAALNGMFNGQSLTQSLAGYGSFSADRVTQELKVSLGAGGNFQRNSYKLENESIVNNSYGGNLSGLVVKSLNDHWSYGGSAYARNSTYSNLKAGLGLYPGVEYDLFPYSQAQRRQLRFLYKIGVTPRWYYSETLYDKMQEVLFSHMLSITLGLKEKWGSVGVSLLGSNYLHDWSKGQVGLDADISWNLAKGLALTLAGNVALVHDQISLPKIDPTRDQTLTDSRELPTEWNYGAMVGIKYTFGSVYNNVVNPRFGK